MRKILLAGLLFLGAFAVYGQTGIGTAGQQEYARALTNAGKFGVTRYTTALLPTCNTGNLGALAYDTTAALTKVCTGAAWANVGAGAGAGLTVGAAITGGVANRVLFEDAGNLVGQDADFTFLTDTLTATRLRVGDGDATAPTMSFTSRTGDGFFIRSGSMRWGVGGTEEGNFSSSGIMSVDGFSVNNAVSWSSEGGGLSQFGADVTSGNGTDQLLKGPDTTTATDASGGDFTLTAGRGTGTGASSVIIQAPTPLATGTTAQTLATMLTLIDGGAAGVSAPQALIANGSAGVPSFGFLSDADGTGTGLYRFAANQIGVSTNGVGVWRWSGAQLMPVNSDDQDLGDAATLVRTLHLTRSIQGSKTKTLTPASATTFVTIGVPQTANVNYAGGEVVYTVFETDGTDMSSLSGVAKFACVNKAGTESCAAIVDSQTAAVVTGADTLTCTITAVVGLTDVIGLAANCTDAGTMTETLFQIQYRIDMPQPNAVAPQ